MSQTVRLCLSLFVLSASLILAPWAPFAVATPAEAAEAPEAAQDPDASRRSDDSAKPEGKAEDGSTEKADTAKQTKQTKQTKQAKQAKQAEQAEQAKKANPSKQAKAAPKPVVPDVIFVPTPTAVVDKMLELAAVKKTDLLYDLGCGDGRIVIAAAKKIGCKAVGYDIDPVRIRDSRANVRKEKIGNLVSIQRKDIFTLDLSKADVVTLYLLPSLNVRLIPQLEKLKPGCRIVSHDFDMAGVEPDKLVELTTDDDEHHKVYLWTTPLKKVAAVEEDEDEEEDEEEETEEKKAEETEAEIYLKAER